MAQGSQAVPPTQYSNPPNVRRSVPTILSRNLGNATHRRAPEEHPRPAGNPMSEPIVSTGLLSSFAAPNSPSENIGRTEETTCEATRSSQGRSRGTT
jgi:hypothetical protein